MTQFEQDRPVFLTVRGIASLVMFAATLIFGPTAPAAAGGSFYSGEPISLDVVDADLQHLLGRFSDVTGFVFAVDAQTVEMGGLDHLVTVDYEEVPWDRALDEILVASGLTWTLEGKVLWIHLPDSAPTGDRNFTGDTINLRLEDAKLADVLSTLAKVTGVDIEFNPEIETTISVALRSVPWDQALDLILRISGFDSFQDGKNIEVFRVRETKGMQLMAASAITAE